MISLCEAINVKTSRGLGCKYHFSPGRSRLHESILCPLSLLTANTSPNRAGPYLTGSIVSGLDKFGSYSEIRVSLTGLSALITCWLFCLLLTSVF